MKRLIATVIVLVAGTILAPAAERMQRSFAVAPGQKVSFHLKTGGSIRITGWDNNQVAVDVDVAGRDAQDTVVEMQQTAGGVEVTSGYNGRSRNHSSNLQFDVKVPRRFDAEFDTMGGAITITEVEGRFTGKTMGGELDLQRLRGELRLSTMGGDVTVLNCEVDGTVSTMGGKVLVQDVTGDFKASSMGGNVQYKNFRAMQKTANGRVPDASRSVDDEVRISTMGGDIRVPDAPAGANVSTMGGSINIGPAKKFVHAKTMGGDITIQEVDGELVATTMGGNITARVTGTGPEISRPVDLTSMGGEITLYVPDGLSMQFDVELAYTRNSKQNYQIQSDFGLQVRATDDWDYSQGSPRKYYYGTGSVQGGRNRIRIQTINGNVYIRRGN